MSKPVQAWLSVAALLAGATMWGVVWYPMRLLEGAGVGGLWLTLLLYTAAVVAGFPLAGREIHWFARRPMLLSGLGLSAGWTNIAFILAILDGNILRVLLLFYLSPVWATALGWLILKEHVNRGAVLVLVVALAGAGLMLWQPGAEFPWPRDSADWLALSSGFGFAVSNLFVRYGAEIPVSLKSLSVWLGVVALAAVLIAVLGRPHPSMTPGIAAGIVGLGWFGTVVMTVLVQYGVSRMPVHRSAIILLFELVAGALSQQLLTTETMSLREWSGGALVVAAAFLSAWREKH